MRTRVNSVAEASVFVKRKASQLMGALTSGPSAPEVPMTPRLAVLVDAYATSEVASSIRVEIDTAEQRAADLPDVAVEDELLKGRKGATWSTQFRILAGRAFKNLYRDPMLLTMHYFSSIALACESRISSSLSTVAHTVSPVICGFFFHHVK